MGRNSKRRLVRRMQAQQKPQRVSKREIPITVKKRAALRPGRLETVWFPRTLSPNGRDKRFPMERPT